MSNGMYNQYESKCEIQSLETLFKFSENLMNNSK